MFFGFNTKVIGPKENKIIPDDFPGFTDGICSNGNQIALYSADKKSIFLINIDKLDWNRLKLAASENQKVQFRNILWIEENTKLLAILKNMIIIYSIESGEAIAKNGIESENNSYIDAVVHEGLIYVLHSQKTIRIYDTNLEKVQDVEIDYEPSAICNFGNIFVIGCQNGKVLIFEKGETFEKTNEFRATASPIENIQMTEDKLFISSKSDNVLWNNKFVPQFSVKSISQIIYTDPTLKFGLSLTQGKLYFHKIAKGNKSETSAVLPLNCDGLIEKPYFQWLDENTLRAFVVTPMKLFVIMFEKPADKN
ncbi:hypothetical protein TVAG_145380 [Trichomonas vaginalis G3]|uniref:Uncharacterized protein n=1 Tax=Trichomonas vaginalis (strain ATCC PRA-98 / G3) TaxID=412133 RepID=A2EUM0_TRIV3|nr:WD40 repeat-like family [Trichomonas vaginalis G3]EAY03669.1 hypothetical protein TVAG_145380 [Trichomonas vaginalis G3]KAI5520277.1 WD40 repeat-like family [Trichomonas vaginalis G3]|eukprot:XP_001315892.1 hypothetical protein [Trichomonas vaginalis G3]